MANDWEYFCRTGRQLIASLKLLTGTFSIRRIITGQCSGLAEGEAAAEASRASQGPMVHIRALPLNLLDHGCHLRQTPHSEILVPGDSGPDALLCLHQHAAPVREPGLVACWSRAPPGNQQPYSPARKSHKPQSLQSFLCLTSHSHTISSQFSICQ